MDVSMHMVPKWSCTYLDHSDLISLFTGRKNRFPTILSTNFLFSFAQNLHNSKFDAITAIHGFAPVVSFCKSIFSTCDYRSSLTGFFIGILWVKFSASVILSKPFASAEFKEPTVLFISAVFRLDIFSRVATLEWQTVLDPR